MSLVRMLPALVIGVFVLAACAGQPAPTAVEEAPAAIEEVMEEETASEEMTDGEAESSEETTHSEEMAEEMTEGDDSMSADAPVESPTEPEIAAVERPSWQQITLVDARTGEEFTLADYDGNTIFVESFATWCGNCRRQLGNVQEAHAQIGEEALFLALSVEPNISSEALVEYADKQGFQYTFAAMPPEMLQQLAAELGQTIGNPPATPHFIVGPDGTTSELVTGFEDAGLLIEQIEAASS